MIPLRTSLRRCELRRQILPLFKKVATLSLISHVFSERSFWGPLNFIFSTLCRSRGLPALISGSRGPSREVSWSPLGASLVALAPPRGVVCTSWGRLRAHFRAFGPLLCIIMLAMQHICATAAHAAHAAYRAYTGYMLVMQHTCSTAAHVAYTGWRHAG